MLADFLGAFLAAASRSEIGRRNVKKGSTQLPPARIAISPLRVGVKRNVQRHHHAGRGGVGAAGAAGDPAGDLGEGRAPGTVSYTHLTLQTILRV